MSDDTVKSPKHPTPTPEPSDTDAGRTKTLSTANRSTTGGSGSLEVRCPNCHSPMDVAVDTALTDLTCASCGSHFSLVDQSEATHIAPSLTRLGRFELVERLGVGGFGSVWKARDKELDRTVAIKIPRHGGMTAEEQEKFFREARAAAQLRHPNIVSVHEVGRDGDNVYIVSDFVRGVTLGDWLTGQQLTTREAVELCAKIADALDHAHEQGVVHRDLKPANIMIDGDAQPHLMDFGLARREVGEVTVTIDGQVLGTPAYMSPEQAQGEGHTADRRSDVYSLGVILFQLLTGERPFRGNARMLIHQVIHDPAPSPRKLNGNVRKDLETITLKCLEKDPSSRYATARDLTSDLRRFLAGETITARPASQIERAWRWVKRRPASAALLGLLTAVAIIAPMAATRQAALRRTAESAELEARDSERRALSEAQRATREAATSQRLANFVGAKYALSQNRLSEAYQQVTAAMQSEPAWEYGRILSDVVNESRRDWKLLLRIPISNRPGWGCFVGSGPKWLALGYQKKLELHSVVGDHSITSVELERNSYLPCSIGTDRLALGTGNNIITVFDLPSLKVVAECEFPGRVVEIRSHYGGKYFVALNEKRLVRVFDRDGHQRAEKTFATDQAEVRTFPSIDLSPSGRAVSYDSGVWTKPKKRWLWQSDQVAEFKLQVHTTRLRDDDTACGIMTYGGGGVAASDIYFVSAKVNENEEYEFQGHNFIYNTGSRLTTGQASKTLDGMAVISEQGINLLEAPPAALAGHNEQIARYDLSTKSLSTRFLSLWPHNGEPRFLAFDDRSRTLTLTTDRDVLLFVRWLPTSELGSKADFVTSYWSLAVDKNRAYIAGGSENVPYTIQMLDFSSFSRKDLSIVSPKPVEAGHAPHAHAAAEQSVSSEKLMLLPWSVAAASQSPRIAVLWQEADTDTIAAKYYRKIVSVYERPQGSSREARLVSEFELKDFFGRPGRTNRILSLTPDGSVVAFVDSAGRFAGYRAIDGQKLFTQIHKGATTTTTLNDPPRLGVGDSRGASSYRVWDLATGKSAGEIPLDGAVRASAFAPDGKSVYVGLVSKTLKQYRVSDGALLAEIHTAVSPIAISPNGNRFIGFVADTETVGSMVLADLSNGHTLEVINPAANIINRAFFSNDGKSFAYVVNREKCAATKGLDIDEATNWLEQPAIDPHLASASSDLHDYRERLVQMLVPYIPGDKESKEFGATRESAQKAQDVIISLLAEAPDDPRYREMLALNCERLARFEPNSQRLQMAEDIWRGLIGQNRDINVSSNSPQVLNDLAWFLSTSDDGKIRNGSRAVKFATRACNATHFETPSFVDTLAAAYAESGDFDAAVKWSEKAIALLDKDTSPEERDDYSHRLANYKAKKPTRDQPNQ
jgi:WD40 repeat protein/ribosomal protein S27E